MTAGQIHPSRRDWLCMCLAAPCAPHSADVVRFQDLPPAATVLARELGLTPEAWDEVLAAQQKDLALRIDQGSAEHIIYYVLQSTGFTSRPAIDPVRLAASRPSSLPPEVEARFEDFQKERTVAAGERARIIHELWRQLGDSWPLERCFRHTLEFLGTRQGADRQNLDRLYQQRGLATDTVPSQIAVLERAFETLATALDSSPMLLIGPGLDLTRREGFQDDLPLKSYQTDWLARRGTIDCMDVRPEVVKFLKDRGQCVFSGDVTRNIPGRIRYSAAFATNVLLYLNDRLLFLAFAVVNAALRPGGFFVHNDQRFAAKVFGESFGMPVTAFQPVSLGVRAGVEQMDRVVIHRKTLATGAPK